jgi:single-strand DNA-binding protein
MKSLNRVELIGLLGADPKIYAMPSGTMVAKFCMATHYVYKDKKVANVIKKTTEWHAVVAISDLATVVERFLQKGTCVYVDGSIKTREYQDKDKTTKRVTEIVAHNLIVLYGGKEEVLADSAHKKSLAVVQVGGN